MKKYLKFLLITFVLISSNAFTNVVSITPTSDGKWSVECFDGRSIVIDSMNDFSNSVCDGQSSNFYKYCETYIDIHPQKWTLKAIFASLEVDSCNELNEIINEVTDLNLSSGRVQDLTVLKYFKNIKFLNLDNNINVSDYNSIGNLSSLESLSAKNNNIIEINALSKLEKLQTLDLSDNNISKITFLEGLYSLESLLLENNKIVDLTSLRGLLKLSDLNLAHNLITNIKPLKGLNELLALNLGYNGVANISSLKRNSNLEYLYLGHNKIENLGYLGTVSLREIYFEHNLVKKIGTLSHLEELRIINADNNLIYSSSDNLKLAVLINLEKLYLRGNNLLDIDKICPIEDQNLCFFDYTQNNPPFICDSSKNSNIRCIPYFLDKRNACFSLAALGEIPDYIKTCTFSIRTKGNMSNLQLAGQMDFSISTMNTGPEVCVKTFRRINASQELFGKINCK